MKASRILIKNEFYYHDVLHLADHDTTIDGNFDIPDLSSAIFSTARSASLSASYNPKRELMRYSNPKRGLTCYSVPVFLLASTGLKLAFALIFLIAAFKKWLLQNSQATLSVLTTFHSFNSSSFCSDLQEKRRDKYYTWVKCITLRLPEHYLIFRVA